MSKKKTKKPRRLRKYILWALAALIVTAVVIVGYTWLTLPEVEHLKNQNPPSTAMIKLREAEAEKKGETLQIRQKWVRFDHIPKLLKKTVIVSEDAAFYQHEGFDFYEFKEGFWNNFWKGKKVRGGSTITQQLAKNLFLSPRKSYYRKIREYFIAKRLEEHLSKNRIFHIYLNVIELGKGVFGVEAASQYFFKKPAGQLSLEEIVRLVAVFPKPLRVTPLSNSRYLKWRARLLLDRLKKYKYISSQEYHRAIVGFRK